MKINKRMVTMLFIFIFMLIPSIKVRAITLNKTSATIKVGEEVQIQIIDLEEGQTIKKVEWSSEGNSASSPIGQITWSRDDLSKGSIKGLNAGKVTYVGTITLEKVVNAQSTGTDEQQTGENTNTDNKMESTETLKIELTVQKDKDDEEIKEEKPEEKETEKKEEKIPVYTLKKLDITGGELDKKFSGDTFNYKLKITDFSKFKIVAEATDSDGFPMISDIEKLETIRKSGITISVVVDNNQDSSKVYKLTLDEEIPNTKLKSIKMPGYAFNEAFNPDTKDYTVTIPYQVTTITIDAVPEDSNAKVSIPSSSLNNLSVGGNKVTITVTNGNSKTVYTLYVTRSEKTELEETATSIIGSNIDESNTSNNSGFDIPDVDDPDSFLSIFVICVGSLILFIIGGIGIYFFIKTSPRRMKKELIRKQQMEIISPIIEVKENESMIDNLEINDENKDE